MGNGGLTSMPERKPDKVITATRPTRITFDGHTVDIDASKRGWPVVRIWLDDTKTTHVRVAKLSPVSDTSE